MGYQEFDMKFSQRKPPKLSKSEIDAMYMTEFNNGSSYVLGKNGAMHITDWRDEMYKDNGISTQTQDIGFGSIGDEQAGKIKQVVERMK